VDTWYYLVRSIVHNAKNKERMEDKIKDIIKEFSNPREEVLNNAVERICYLFDVSEPFYCKCKEPIMIYKKNEQPSCSDCGGLE